MKHSEIIESLRHCSVVANSCRGCPRYNQDSGCLDKLHTDAVALLEELLAALKKADDGCRFCVHALQPAPCEAADCDCSICTADCICKTCQNNSNWQWKGRVENGN